MGIFRNSLLCEYNSIIGDLLVINCSCYKIYQDEERFKNEIIKERKSYMGCIFKKRITHTCIPIMIGSHIDYKIRGYEKVKRDQILWGTFILKGMLHYYTIFSTYDALSMHVVYTKKSYHIEFYTYCKGNGVAIKYKNHIVEWIYEGKHYNSNEDGESWIDLLNYSNKYTQEVATSCKYRELFEAMLKYPYDMNSLANRRFLSGPTVMKKYIDYHFEPRSKQTPSLASAFENGTIFVALCKNNQYENVEWFKNYSQSYNIPLNDGRSDKSEHFLSTVTRVVNKGLRNSKKALSFPHDAYGFFCPLNTKDMKSAGEQNVLTDETIISMNTYDMPVYEYIQSKSQNDGDYIFLNDHETHCRIKMDLNALIELKKKFPHVTTRYYRPFVLITTKNSILLKYLHKYKVFFSPAEITEFEIEISETSILSITGKTLNKESYRRNQPAKSTVAINNFKGSVAICHSEFHEFLMKNTLGYSCYMRVVNQKRLLDSAIIDMNCDISNFTKLYTKYVEPIRNSAIIEDDIHINETIESIRKSILNIYDFSKLLSEYKRMEIHNKSTIKFTTSKIINKNKDELNKYLKLILGRDTYDVLGIKNINLYCMFGNYKGATIEDGVILDKTAVKIINENPIIYNALLTVDFIFSNIAQAKDATFVLVKKPSGFMNSETLIGCLISNNEAVRIRTSTHCEIKQGRISNHIYYLLHFLPSYSYGDLEINSRVNGKNVSVSIGGVYQGNIIVGSKFANDSGQKNICSRIIDMKDYWGITKSGKKIHAQIIYSDSSIMGRIPSGQLFNMLNSEDLAIGPDGIFIAPIDLVIHTIHPYTNNKTFDIRVDTLTNTNGFDSQNMATVSLALRNSTNKVKLIVNDIFGFHGYQIDFKHDDLRVVYGKFET